MGRLLSGSWVPKVIWVDFARKFASGERLRRTITNGMFARLYCRQSHALGIEDALTSRAIEHPPQSRSTDVAQLKAKANQHLPECSGVEPNQ